MKDAPMVSAAKRAAAQFRGGRGRAWAWTTLRDEIIDAECMDQVRYATGIGGSISGEQITEFRRAFIDAIAKIGFVRE